ncbi:helix-turn-helix domain-containing protein [Nocardia sp. NPDC050717]|uniref:helix-turn-helix domain-containing protein n=1 Tax=Nocardia sp. NPDC050717 TaxID=3157221 RepID=UPI0034004F30
MPAPGSALNQPQGSSRPAEALARATIPRLNELGAFLKARRAELTPQMVELPEHPTVRRVPGLRREEVAQMASISTDYYTRVEQGRRLASVPVLATLAQVFRLDDYQRVYMFELAGKYRCDADPGRLVRINPRWQRLLDQFADTPAIVLGPFADILVWNQLAAALITDFDQLSTDHRNYVHLMLTDRAMRRLFPEWNALARAAVSYLRMDFATYPDSRRLLQLVDELTTNSPEFRRMWKSHAVASLDDGTKTFAHPVVGELTLDWDVLTSAAYPGQRLVVLSAQPGSSSAAALRLLATQSRHRSSEESTGPDTGDRSK